MHICDLSIGRFKYSLELNISEVALRKEDGFGLNIGHYSIHFYIVKLKACNLAGCTWIGGQKGPVEGYILNYYPLKFARVREYKSPIKKWGI